MMHDESTRGIRSVVWGVFLITLGTLFLLARLGVGGFRHLGLVWYAWWPLTFMVIGVTQLIEGHLGAAVSTVMLGLWFFAVTYGWYGLTWTNSWPLALVAGGTGMVLKAVTGEDRWRRRHHLGGDSC